MMKNLLKILLLTTLFLSIFLIAQAQGESLRGESFSYPISELGNCGSKTECKAYCAEEANFEACADFAERHNLLPKEARVKREVLKDVLKNKGPGGCEDKKSCETYCRIEAHQEECLAFAEKHGLINKTELEQAKKFLPLMKRGETPGGCQSKEACENYCHLPENMEVCLDFAKQHNLIPPEELERVNKFLPLMKRGETPGGCKSKEACETYCSQEGKHTECIDFALKIGVMSPEEAQRAKKTGGRGPGGCKGKLECETFCNNPENQETCFQFAKEHGLIEEGEIEKMKEGMGQMRMGLQNAPEEVKECLRQNVDAGTLANIESGEFTPTPGVGQSIRDCFEKFRPQIQEHRGRQFKASPEVEECLKSTVGTEVLEKVKNGEAPPLPELGEKMRSCFEQFGRPQGAEGEGGDQGENHGFDPARFNAPEPVKQCVLEKLSGQEDLNEEKMRPIIEECFRAEREQQQQQQESYKPLPPEMLGQPINDQSQYQQYQPPSDGQYPKQDFGAAPPPVYDSSIMENCKKQVLGDPPQFFEGAREKIEACVKAASGQVRGISTSRLPGFIRWLLGR
ncbi:MAG: hypothetical protein AAB410_00600 [Patescibacteria group bacterium]